MVDLAQGGAARRSDIQRLGGDRHAFDVSVRARLGAWRLVTQGRLNMADACETCRLAVGIFDEPAALRYAMAELRAAGFAERELCLAGQRRAFDALGDAAAGDSIGPDSQPHAKLLRAELSRLGEAGAGRNIVVSSGELPQMLLRHAQSNRKASTGPSSLMADMCERTTEHMRRGAIVLLAAARDTAQQNRSSRILLRHSTHSVQTYEFTPRSSP